MKTDRIRNVLLTLIAAILALDVAVTLAPPAHAAGKTQYKAVAGMDALNDAASAQRILDQMSAQGWEYAGSNSLVMIFKK